MDGRIACSPELRDLLAWCQRKAGSEREHVQRITGRGKTESVKLRDDQFTYGRNTAAHELEMRPSTLRDRMAKLEAYGAITVDPLDAHYSVVTVHVSG